MEKVDTLFQLSLVTTISGWLLILMVVLWLVLCRSIKATVHKALGIKKSGRSTQ